MKEYYIIILHDECEQLYHFLVKNGKTCIEAGKITNKKFNEELRFFLKQPKEKQFVMLEQILKTFKEDFRAIKNE
jgi:hypothetical protein